MNDDVSIRMNSEDSLAPPAFLFAPRPDKKGPKTIAILLVLGSILMLLVGWGDFQNSMADDFPDADLDAILGNYQNQDINITEEEYQEYHDEVRDDGAYSVRGYSLLIGGVLVLSGGVLLFRLNMLGVKLSLAGSLIGLIGGFGGTWMMVQVSDEFLPKEVTTITELMSYLCGVCMFMCVALAALPILNASARAALNENVTLVNEEETMKESVDKVVEANENNLPQDDEDESDETEETAGNVYNIQNITIQDSVVVDSVFTNSEEE